MKYIKTFDKLKIKENAEIGDYVLCSEPGDLFWNDINFFIENNIGEIIDLNRGYDYIVKYNNIPKEIKDYFAHLDNSIPPLQTARGMHKSEIKYKSKNKKDLESILLSKKYNL